jgi:hypothetical protein
MSITGYRTRQRERRKKILQFSGIGLVIFLSGYGIGTVTHSQTFTAIDGQTPVPCLTLAIIPADVLPKPKQVTLNVLNGSKRMGIAGIAGEIFTSRGFTVASVGNFDDYEVSATAEIHYGPAGAKAAQLAAAYFADAVLKQDDRAGATVDVIVGQKFDNVASNADAHRELLRPSASPSGPGC